MELETCTHSKTVEEGGYLICVDCGVESGVLSYTPEWRCYEGTAKEVSRCRITQTQVSRIGKILADKNTPHSVASLAEEKYDTVVGDRTIRGNSSLGILVPCVMFSYRKKGIYYPADALIKRFGITQKILSQGLSAYYKAYPEDRTVVVQPKNLISTLMKNIGIDMQCEQDIVDLAEKLENTSVELSRSEPQSVAAAIIFLYTCWKPKYYMGISKKEFADRAGLSVVTIVRLAKIAAEKLGLSIVI